LPLQLPSLVLLVVIPEGDLRFSTHPTLVISTETLHNRTVTGPAFLSTSHPKINPKKLAHFSTPRYVR
jgi:hypothetical protein